jgi:hypothetical protein
MHGILKFMHRQRVVSVDALVDQSGNQIIARRPAAVLENLNEAEAR